MSYFLYAQYANLLPLKKRETTAPNEYIELKANEYKIDSHFDTSLGKIPYLPNVKTYATFDNKIIAFTSARPTKEIDVEFICRKVSDNVYECVSYIDLSNKCDIRKIVDKTIECLMFFSSILMPVIIACMDTFIINGADVTEFNNLFTAYVTLIFGGAGSKLFSNTKGFGWVLYVL